jgi:hypothetical protein
VPDQLLMQILNTPPESRGWLQQSGEDSVVVVFEQRYGWARAYRDGRLVAGRVRLAVGHEVPVGLAPRERRRRSLRAAFTERVDPALRAELAAVARRRGAAARRAADRMQPIEVIVDDPHHGRGRIVGRVLPPQQPRGDLDEIEFSLRELV